MIPKITRGADTPGLVRYLLGPGRHEEHHDQRVIAAAAGIEVPVGVTLSDDVRRDLAVQMKLIVIPEIVKGKRVVVVEDSIVRGTTTRGKMHLAVRVCSATAVRSDSAVCAPFPYPSPEMCFGTLHTSD